MFRMESISSEEYGWVVGLTLSQLDSGATASHSLECDQLT